MKFKRLFLAATFLVAAQNILASVNIFVQPQNQSVPVGSNAVFNASTTTSAGEIITGYTWLTSTNSSGPFSTIPGATGPVLTITNAQFSNSGFYFVRVNYQSGGNPGIAVSTAVTLSVQDQARITGQPANQTRAVGSSASFTVAAAGEAPLGFQWRFQGTKLLNSARISGANSATLTISNLLGNDAGNYDVIVSNAYSSATSHVAVLSILFPPSFTLQPSNTTALVGETVTLSAAAEGTTPLGYRWRKNGFNLSNSGRFSGVTSSTLVITGARTNDSGVYSVVVTNSVGSITSSNVSVAILAPPVFTSGTNVLGKQGAPLNFKLTASGSAPITFGSDELPNGLSLDATSGQVSGTPLVSGIFPVTFFASNAASNATTSVVFNITTGAPGIISALAVNGQQGMFFTYSIFASNNPVFFSASELPAGLNFDSTNGVISGIPELPGVFPITITASNQFGGDSQELTVTVTTSAPVITSALSVTGQQGGNFSYSIVASNNPVLYTASGVPSSLNFDPNTGVISGFALESGTFSVVIGASNSFGADSQILELNLATAAPVITSELVATATENQPFTYTILASHSPASFNATGLPPGLVVDPSNGVISGTPVVGGTNDVVISAKNRWGVGTAILQIRTEFAPITNLFITDVTWNYSKPYILDFTFSLRDNRNPSLGRAIVRPVEQIKVVCKEGDTNQQDRVLIGNETGFLLSPGITANAKQLKTSLVLDYTYSLFIVPDAIDTMEAAVKNLIKQEPPSAQFAVSEFNADYVDPALVQDFTTDKLLLSQAIDGIRTNFVQGNYAGSRLYDALADAIANFGPVNPDEQRQIVVMSDGYDDSSILTPPAEGVSIPAGIIASARAAKVQIYCVGFGTNVNTAVLQQISLQTGGRYFAAANVSQIATQFALLLKDLNAQYYLRWTTLQRGVPFQPMFDVTIDSSTASYNTNFPFKQYDLSVDPPVVTNIVKIDTTFNPPVTRQLDYFVPDFNPADFAGNVQVGELRLVPDSATNASAVTLRAFYTPRYVREIKLHYRANYPCTPMLLSTGPGEMLNGWTLLTGTNDGIGTNGSWLTLVSTDPTNVLTSLPYGIRGDLVKFQFPSHSLADPQQAFSFFEIDNTVYTNFPPSGQSFTLETNQFVTFYSVPPPHGTPIPWLIANGFTDNFDAAELLDPNGNGMPVWQEYLAGLDPNDPNASFAVRVFVAGQPASGNEITFSTVAGKTYRVEASVNLVGWVTVEDNITGTGGEITVSDERDLSAFGNVFYRIAVY